MFLCLQKLLSPSPAGKNRYSAKRIKTDLKILISLPLFSPYDTGYHFSYLGDIRYKLKSWGHADRYDRPPYNDPEHIKNA